MSTSRHKVTENVLHKALLEETLSYFFQSLYSPSGPGPPHYCGFTITLRHTTLGRAPLDEGSARHRDLYLTSYNIHRHPCPRWDPDPQPQHASDRRSTPETARPLGSAILSYTVSKFKECVACCKTLMFAIRFKYNSLRKVTQNNMFYAVTCKNYHTMMTYIH
jgi:hypothetical protein